MDIEKSVVDVLCSTVNIDLCTQVLDFCECRSTKIMCKSNLVQHEKGCKFNPNKKEYKCELCGKGKFYLYKKVQEHKRKDHKGYK